MKSPLVIDTIILLSRGTTDLQEIPDLIVLIEEEQRLAYDVPRVFGQCWLDIMLN